MNKSKRRVARGVVISDKMKNTVTVKVTKKMKHPKYGKVVERYKKYYAHDDSDKIKVGAQVKIMESKPYSKLKRWRVVKTLEEVL